MGKTSTYWHFRFLNLMIKNIIVIIKYQLIIDLCDATLHAEKKFST